MRGRKNKNILFLVTYIFNQGILNFFFVYFIQHCPSDSAASEEAGIEPRTVGILALEAYLLSNKCNHSARSHPQLGQISFTNLARSHLQLGWISPTTRLDLVHNQARSHSQLGQISSITRLDLIHNLARSHPQLGDISSKVTDIQSSSGYVVSVRQNSPG